MSFAISQSLSLLIPRVFPQWTDEQVIIDIFHQQHIGRVYKVNVIRMPNRTKRSYPIYQAFVYFSAWYDTAIAYNFQQRIFGAKKQARVVYDDPWFWVAFENKKRTLSNNDKRLIRLGYQAYVNDQRIEQLENRLENLEATNAEDTVNARIWPISDSWCDVPEEPKVAKLNASAAPFVVLAKAKAKEPVPEPHLAFKHLSEAFVMSTLGDELNLTETAVNVAERALMETDEEREAELNLTETALSVAESALQEYESEESEFYREDYYENNYGEDNYDDYDY
jgi:hypothetical protein